MKAEPEELKEHGANTGSADLQVVGSQVRMAASYYVMALGTVLPFKHRGNDGRDGPIERDEASFEVSVAGELESLPAAQQQEWGSFLQGVTL